MDRPPPGTIKQGYLTKSPPLSNKGPVLKVSRACVYKLYSYLVHRSEPRLSLQNKHVSIHSHLCTARTTLTSFVNKRTARLLCDNLLASICGFLALVRLKYRTSELILYFACTPSFSESGLSTTSCRLASVLLPARSIHAANLSR